MADIERSRAKNPPVVAQQRAERVEYSGTVGLLVSNKNKPRWTV
jgi:hypothetical protein